MFAASLWPALTEALMPILNRYRNEISRLAISTKADRTLLTEADIVTQQLIVDKIRAFEPGATIIAEEDDRTGTRQDVLSADGRLWVVDPIDGTAEFVDGSHVEYCSVVCVLEDWQPMEAFILAPELGAGRTPIVATANAITKKIVVNGDSVQVPLPARPTRSVSATRSKGAPPSRFDSIADDAGIHVKTRTTSQTLDMLRTAVDLTRIVPGTPRFELFWRRDQKLWDGVAGMCFGHAAGMIVRDDENNEVVLDKDFLSAPMPTFEATVMGTESAVSWFLDHAR